MINTKETNGQRNGRSSQPVKETAPRRCLCPCCYKCLQIVIGFILLLVVTGSITLIRGFLEVPTIINGFAPNHPAKTLATTSLASTVSTTSPTNSNPQGESSNNVPSSQPGKTQVSSVTNSSVAIQNYSTEPNSNISSVNNSWTNTQIYSTEEKCDFVGELKVIQKASIQLNSDPNSEEYIDVAQAIENKINMTYKSSALKTKYITTKLIGISPVHSAIRFWMYFRCNVIYQQEDIAGIFKQIVGNITLPNSGQLTLRIDSNIEQCQDYMLTCASGYCVNKTNGYCDDINDCWDGSDEALCACEGSSAAGCSSMVTLIGKKYRKPCHGSLIASEWVLTSSSCANDSSFLDVCTASSLNPKRYQISKRHTVDWRGEGIALLQLGTAVDSKLLQPIPLPDSTDQSETGQTTCRVTSKRNSTYQAHCDLYTGEYLLSVRKHNFRSPAHVSVLGWFQCSNEDKWRVIASNRRIIKMRKSSSELEICQVEAGSPLMCFKGNNTWVLTAIRARSNKCTIKYKRINNFLSLIKQYIN